MTTLSVPWLALLILVPALYGAFISRLEDIERAKLHATIASAITILGSLALVVFIITSTPQTWLDPLTWPGGHPLLGIDGFAAALLPALGLMALAWIISTPKRLATPSDIATMLLMLATTMGQLLSMSLDTFALFSVLWALIASKSDTEPFNRRLRHRLLIPTSISLLIAAIIVEVSTVQDPLAPTLTQGWITSGSTLEWLVFGLIALNVIVRLGFIPTQWWLPSLMSRGPLGQIAMPAAAMPAAWLLYRALCPELFIRHELDTIAVWLAASSALVAAIMALSQHNLRRLLGMLTLVQSGLVSVGLVSGISQGSVGGLMLWLASALALTGLGVTIQALESRLGSCSTLVIRGAGANLPQHSLAFLLFGLMAIGMPGTLDFIGDELIFEGAIHAGIGPTIASVLAVGLSGIAMLKAWSEAFIGPVSEAAKARVCDLRRQERLVLSLLIVAIIGFGVLPHGLLAIEARFVAPHDPSAQQHTAAPAQQLISTAAPRH